MPEKFTVEIISPDRTLLKRETSEVIIPSYEGEMGILKEHIPLITFLRPGIVKIKDNEEKSFFVEEGTVEFKENNLFSEFIETQHNLSARLIAKMFNFNYTRVSTKFGLNLYLRTFFKNSKKPKILEIKTSSVKSTKILKEYFRYLSKP